MPHFGGKMLKEKKKATAAAVPWDAPTHTHAKRTTPEHINSVLQSAIDSNQSCDLNNIVIMNTKVNKLTDFPKKENIQVIFIFEKKKVFDYFSIEKTK